MIHAELGANVAIRARQGGGDVEAAFARAGHVVKQRYESQRVAPAPLETRGIIADFQADSDSLTVWNSTQAPHRVRDYLAQTLARPADSIRVVAPDVGGSFGMKDCIYPRRRTSSLPVGDAATSHQMGGEPAGEHPGLPWQGSKPGHGDGLSKRRLHSGHACAGRLRHRGILSTDHSIGALQHRPPHQRPLQDSGRER